MEKYLSKKQYMIGAWFQKNAYLAQHGDESYPTIDIVSFKHYIYDIYPDLIFVTEKQDHAVQIDDLRLYTVLSDWNDPDIEIKLQLFKNPDGTFYIEATRSGNITT